MTPVDDGRSGHATSSLAQSPRASENQAPAHSSAPAAPPSASSRATEATARGHRTVATVSLVLIALSIVLAGVGSGWGMIWLASPVDAGSLLPASELSLVDVPLALGDAELEPYIAAVAQTDSVEHSSWRLAEGLAPPTNRWFSPLALEANPQPVHPLPFSVQVVGGVLRVSIPGDDDAAVLTPLLAIDTGATSWFVSDYTDASVTLTFASDDTAIAIVVLTRGSPVIGYRALTDHAVSVDAVLEPVTPTLLRTTLGASTLGLVGPHLALSADGRSVAIARGSVANWVLVPDGGDLGAIAPFAATTVTDTSVSYTVNPDVTTTTIDFDTLNGGRAVFGVFTRLGTPTTTESGAVLDCSLGTFETPMGALRVCSGTGFAYAVPTVDPLLVVARPSSRAVSLPTVEGAGVGAAAAPLATSATGPRLARLAAELRMARLAGDAALVQTLTEQLTEPLMIWSELEGCDARAERCLAFDPVLQAMVAFDDPQVAEVGNARLVQNGDLLFAAGVVASDDSALVSELRPMMTLLAADLVGSSSSTFAARRAFDPVSGVSWSSCEAWLQLDAPELHCSGPAPMPSTAVLSAYSGVAQWAVAAGDPWLLEHVTWMLSVERAGSRSG